MSSMLGIETVDENGNPLPNQRRERRRFATRKMTEKVCLGSGKSMSAKKMMKIRSGEKLNKKPKVKVKIPKKGNKEEGKAEYYGK